LEVYPGWKVRVDGNIPTMLKSVLIGIMETLNWEYEPRDKFTSNGPMNPPVDTPRISVTVIVFMVSF
jgi:hypothetical protein